MDNGANEQVFGVIINGAWQPQTIKFYVYIMIAPQKYEWQEIDEEIGCFVNWNKAIPLIEEKVTDGSLKFSSRINMRQTLKDLGVLTVTQVPQAVINGQVVGTVEQLTIHDDYKMTYDNSVEQIPIIDLTEQVKKNEESRNG